MSAIAHALNTIRYTIPMEVLNATFSNCDGYQLASIEEKIRMMVIVGRVLRDIDLIHGETVFLPLNAGEITDRGPTSVSVFYSDEYLQGREIISVRLFHDSTLAGSLSGSHGGVTGIGIASSGPRYDCNSRFDRNTTEVVNNILDKIEFQSNPIIPSMGNNATMVAKNTIALRYHRTISEFGEFEVQLNNDPELNNISPKSIPSFTELCVLALKSYIYNNKVVSLGHQGIYAGQHYNQLNSVIEGYSDAEEQYKEYLNTTWSRVSYMNDTTAYHELITLSINPFT